MNSNPLIRKIFTPATAVAAGLLLLAFLYSGTLFLFAPNDPIRGKKGWLVSTDQIPPARPLAEFPTTVGPYVKVAEERLDKDTERTLGTTNYIVWTYRDTRGKDGATVTGMRFQFAYWSGTRQILSTGVHYPELCYVGGGAKTLDASTVDLSLRPKGGTAETVPLRIFQFVSAGGGPPGNVGYFFIMNGRRIASADYLRIATFLGPTRNLYYCKVECMPCTLRKNPDTGRMEAASGVADPEAAKEIIRQFLELALPDVEKMLPQN